VNTGLILSYNYSLIRGADRSLARPGRKQANVSVRWREFPSALDLAGGGEPGTSRLGFVEIAPVPGLLPSFFPSWSG